MNVEFLQARLARVEEQLRNEMKARLAAEESARRAWQLAAWGGARREPTAPSLRP